MLKSRPDVDVSRNAIAVLYTDAHLLIIDKPSGLAVHPGPRTPHSLEALLPRLREGYQRPPMITHRLDRDTSGVLVLARHPKAHKKINAAFESGQVRKIYWALTHKAPPQDSGVIDVPLLKISSAAEGWRMVVDDKGKVARTDYRVLGRKEGLFWLELTPHTGRTHQLRVHLAHIGCPISGDPIYGEDAESSSESPLGRMALHAHQVTVPPMAKDAEPLTVCADWPEMTALFS